MKIKAFFDEQTATVSYVVSDENTKDAVIIDPVMNYDQGGSSYSFQSVNNVMEYVESNGLKVHYIMETHAHADHLTGAQELKKRLPNTQVVINNNITKVQDAFKTLFNLGENFLADGSQFDRLVADNEVIQAGAMNIKVLHTPGHTPACSSYLIEDVVFAGDALFMPDFGVARCDFPAGSAAQLYNSVKTKLFTLDDKTRVFTAHDYPPAGRGVEYETTIGDSKKNNIHINEKTTEEEFVKFRTQRDKTLAAPKLLLPSLAINIDAGHLPKPEGNNVSYLKIPIRPAKGE